MREKNAFTPEKSIIKETPLLHFSLFFSKNLSTIRDFQDIYKF